MIKWDIGKSGKGILSVYATKDEESFIARFIGKLGHPTIRYYNQKGKAHAFEWWFQKGRRLIPIVKKLSENR